MRSKRDDLGQGNKLRNLSVPAIETNVGESFSLCLLMRVPDERDQTNYESENRRVFFRTQAVD